MKFVSFFLSSSFARGGAEEEEKQRQGSFSSVEPERARDRERGRERERERERRGEPTAKGPLFLFLFLSSLRTHLVSERRDLVELLPEHRRDHVRGLGRVVGLGHEDEGRVRETALGGLGLRLLAARGGGLLAARRGLLGLDLLRGALRRGDREHAHEDEGDGAGAEVGMGWGS